MFDSYGQVTTYKIGDHVYPFELFLFSAVAAAFVFIPTVFVQRENKKFRQQKLAELNAEVVGEANADLAENVSDGLAADVETTTAEEKPVAEVEIAVDAKAEKSTSDSDGSDGK